MWNKGWDKVFKQNEWGKYPDMSVVRFVANNFYKKKERKKVSILEIGCGTGANLGFIAKEGFNCFGIDGSRVAINIAKNKLKREKLKSELKIGDIKKLPYKKNTFDCVIDCECLYSNSFADSLIILNEVKRVLKTKGLFFSKTFAKGTYGDENGPRLPNESNTYKFIRKGSFHKGYGIIRISSLKDIKKLYGAKFKIININYVHRSIENMKKIIKEWAIILQKR